MAKTKQDQDIEKTIFDEDELDQPENQKQEQLSDIQHNPFNTHPNFKHNKESLNNGN